ncbi:hypothetical protein BTH42_31225 [Burkholderia sp. SRS-W-2-2016]|uniref:hypothetical protein n=1 Tax=Burkholderia sp. SRS-W-2-2016 TaxID=1926878 RepID=UPI00094B09BB|nr:hypothetical protein [Burkholderia sp. SRS-W-2-2016]OLL27691.1 hypothetical protein BTH42_31225 [Burkholderia sp. SRS-W-2-2016]
MMTRQTKPLTDEGAAAQGEPAPLTGASEAAPADAQGGTQGDAQRAEAAGAEPRRRAGEAEPLPRAWPARPRGPLYTWIVHFDAEPSAGARTPDREE